MTSNWTYAADDVHVVFAGKAPWSMGPERPDPEQVVRTLGGPERAAWLRQVHSGDAVRARAGDCGPGDALVTDEAGLALVVVTADCLPIVLASGSAIAVVHAGWRGLEAGVIAAAHGRLHEASGPVRAWIGPAIGACCYEVGEEVPASIEGAVVVPGAGKRPHLDLVATARAQLRDCGTTQVEAVGRCTRCDPTLHSYRRDGRGAGRNYAIAWRSS